MNDLKNIIESLLFVAESPLYPDQVKKAAPEADAREIRKALEALVEDYEQRAGGFALCCVAGGYQFRTRPEYSQWIQKFLQPNPARLSRAAMETLAIVAYHQPVLRSEVEHIRGVNSGNTLKILLERKLIRILGRREIPGRPIVYGSSKKFLETLGLKDLKDLPTPEEIGERANAGNGKEIAARNKEQHLRQEDAQENNT
ncbi:MAG: SMC-Scp complex subunit ScpB [Deltaproteobacteria bacterium]|nr:SMC-Scp complex subunit ScpB [Deltaproteobacteria bacterium]